MKAKFGQSVEEVVRLRGLYLLICFRQTIHWSCLNVDGKTPLGKKKIPFVHDWDAKMGCIFNKFYGWTQMQKSLTKY